MSLDRATTGTVEFRILGPIDVRVAGHRVQLGGARAQKALGVLLADAGRVVPLARLIAALWDDDPPATARQQVHNAIAGLRRALAEPGSSPAIVTDGPGYYVDLGRVAFLDAAEFTLHLDQARQLATDQPVDAIAELRTALGLWRGRALSGHSGLVIEAVSTGLEERRVAAMERLAELCVTQGRHGEVIADLRHWVGEHPHRERLHGLLMLALYLDGNKGEALGVYQRARQVIADDLGLDPGPELSELHLKILRHDSSLRSASAPLHDEGSRRGDDVPTPGTDKVAALATGDASRSPERAATVTRQHQVPAELPWPDRSFTGRHDEVEQMVTRLTSGRQGRSPQITAISGPGGIGKSALAQHVAHVVADHFPDGQLYLNLRGATPNADPMTTQEAIGRLLRSLDVADADIPDTVDEAAASFRSIMAVRHLLILLDDASDPGQIRPLLPGPGSGSAVIVTTRTVPAVLHGADHVRLNSLSDDESVALLGEVAGWARVETELDVAHDIARTCGNLPLALRIAGARLVSRPDWRLGALRDRLRDETARLDELEHADLAVRASCAVSCHDLADDDARAFGLLGLLDLPDFTLPVMAALTDREVPATRAIVDRLVEAQLLTAGTGERYVMHDLLRLYAREQVERQISSGQRSAALRRMIHFHLATARGVARILAPGRGDRLNVGVSDDQFIADALEFPTGDVAAAWVRSEAANLLAVVRQALALGEAGPAHVVALSAVLPNLLHSQGLWSEQMAIADRALEVAEMADIREWIGLAHHDVGMILTIFRRFDAAVPHFEHALADYEELGDLNGQGLVFDSTAACLTLMNKFDEAVEYHERALDVFRALGDIPREARVLNNVAWTLHTAARWNEAIQRYDHSLRLRRQVGDRVGAAITLLGLGDCRLEIGDAPGAISAFDGAAEVFGEIGDSRRHALALWKTGAALHQMNHIDDARACWRRSLGLLRAIGLVTEDEVDEIMASPAPAQPEIMRET